ncbi:MAG: DegQ family serine endoprotease [Phycisphaerae bacterium]|nr:DegQ family serine endoprotease [Phycisphaerae bacterium]
MKYSKKIVPLSLIVVILVANLAIANGIDNLQESSKAFSKIAQKAIPAVVFIQVEKTIESASAQSPFGNSPRDFFGNDLFDHFFRDQTPRQPRSQKYKQQGQGSGFIISSDGYIMTNHHVVGDADEITVRLNDSREFKAKVIGSDEKSDVALIKIDAKNLPTIELGDSDKIDIGEWVFAIGNPFGLSETITFGIISAKGRSNVNIADYEDFIQTDAAINPGNSGGPLINLDGQVIGLNTAIFSRSGGYMGIGFAIPVNMAKYVKDQLIKTGTVNRGQLGVLIGPVEQELADYFNLDKSKGAVITEVVKDSPADKAKLKAGDIILKYNEKEVTDPGQLKNLVGMTPPGQKATITIFRDGKQQKITVKIEKIDESVIASKTSDIARQLGLTVQDINEDTFGTDNTQGVLVTMVQTDSPAAQAGIQPGNVIASVNQKDIDSVKEFNKAIAESKKTKKALLLIKDKNFSRFVVLPVK